MNIVAENRRIGKVSDPAGVAANQGNESVVEFAVPGMGSDHCAGIISTSLKRIGAGADVAIEAADVTLVSGELTKAVEAIRLSKATFRKIQQNLFWAWFYNVAAIPVAAAGLLHPMIGVIAMTSSSLSVIGNSLLLRRAKLTVERGKAERKRP